MPRRSIGQIAEAVRTVLESETELSVRQISLKTQTQWRTAYKALQLLKSLGVVKEKANSKTLRQERLFHLIK